MALNINGIGNYNGKSFLGSSSAKPICGIFLRELFRGEIYQARIDTDDVIIAGYPVQIKNQNSTNTAAGAAMNPNVLSISKAATTSIEISGFVLEAPTDVMQFGETAAHPLKSQVTNVALLGSRVELYLPAADTLQNIQMGINSLEWDFANNCLKMPTSGAGYITPLSPVVDGIKLVNNSGSVEYVDSKVIKVRL